MAEGAPEVGDLSSTTDGGSGTAHREVPAHRLVVAMLGLGEAGGAITADLLAAGVVVRAYDPKVTPPADTVGCRDEADAARGAEVVMSVNSAHDSTGALQAAIAGLAPHAIWAELNTSSPQLKVSLAKMVAAAGRRFVDVALMAPVPGKGLFTPMLVSGDGAEAFAALLRPFGAQVEVVSVEPGVAASRKLLRSVFYKSMAAAAVEALAAARQAGEEEWLLDHLRHELDVTNAATLDRMVEGTFRHARRRADEMRAASEMVSDLGIAPHMSSAAAAVLLDVVHHDVEHHEEEAR